MKQKWIIGLLVVFTLLSLTSVSVLAGNTDPNDGSESNAGTEITEGALTYALNDAGTGYILVGGSAAADNVVIPAAVNNIAVTEIGMNAFSANTAITSVEIPGSVNRIGDNAFISCINLKRVTFSGTPNNADGSIGSQAFGASGITEITIPGYYRTIGYAAFQGCTSLQRVTVSDGVRDLRSNAFKECAALKELTLADSVTTIGPYAFEKCEQLKAVALPENLSVVSYYTFDGCKSLEAVTFNANLTRIQQSAFAWCGLTQIDLSKTKVVDIERYAFGYNPAASVTLPETLTIIGEEAFQNARFTSVTIPDNVSWIGKNAFEPYANTKRTVSLPKMEALNGEIFGDCTGENVQINFRGSKDDWESQTAESKGYYSAFNVKCIGVTPNVTIPADWTPGTDSSWYEIRRWHSQAYGFVAEVLTTSRQGTVSFSLEAEIDGKPVAARFVSALGDDGPAETEPAYADGAVVAEEGTLYFSNFIIDGAPGAQVSFRLKGTRTLSNGRTIDFVTAPDVTFPLAQHMEESYWKVGVDGKTLLPGKAYVVAPDTPVEVTLEVQRGEFWGNLFIPLTSRSYDIQGQDPYFQVQATDNAGGSTSYPTIAKKVITLHGKAGDQFFFGACGTYSNKADTAPNTVTEYQTPDVIRLIIGSGDEIGTQRGLNEPFKVTLDAPENVVIGDKVIVKAAANKPIDEANWAVWPPDLEYAVSDDGLSLEFTAPDISDCTVMADPAKLFVSGNETDNPRIDIHIFRDKEFLVPAGNANNDENEDHSFLSLEIPHSASPGQVVTATVRPSQPLIREIEWTVEPTDTVFEVSEDGLSVTFTVPNIGSCYVTATAASAAGEVTVRKEIMIAGSSSSDTKPPAGSAGADNTGEPAAGILDFVAPLEAYPGQEITVTAQALQPLTGNIQWHVEPADTAFMISPDGMAIRFIAPQTNPCFVIAEACSGTMQESTTLTIRIVDSFFTEPDAAAPPDKPDIGSTAPADPSDSGGAAAENPPDASADPEDPQPVIKPFEPVAGSPITVTGTGEQKIIHGIVAAVKGEPATIGTMLEGISVPAGGSVRVTDANGRELSAEQAAGTGQTVEILDTNGNIIDRATVIIPGDVLGTGKVDIAQLVRLTKAVTGEQPLEGPFLRAGNWTGNGRISIADIVIQARLLVDRDQEQTESD